ncbi:bitter taste receptor 21 [Xenopus tropicalis]|uniref:Taste receptor type 2 n=1 Tax=Xenopus tropicalis TaxID=8364 RepID=Q2AB62_XENTR|nr:bitter taste receptor 21 [Xenopus tropicalis]BAE80405.1 bitter taste receptor [Xenopus tropicalis]|eukprot:NP_001165480.1 bitter taste receptor 21 [Xenopus tropicalis]
MLSALQVIRAVMLIVTWPCGTILNSSIIAVYLSDWKKGVKLGECDQISLSMGCTNLLLQCFVTLGVAFLSYGLHLPFAVQVSFTVGHIYLFFVFLSFWLTASLSTCYCLRLVNPLPKCFIQLKRRLSRIVTPLLVWSVAISSITTVPMNWTLAIATDQNITTMSYNISVNVVHLIFETAFGIGLPSIITSICILLSLISLLRHIRRMKQNPQFGSPQLKNLIRACRTMFLLMALNLLFFLVILSSALPPYSGNTLWQTVIYSCVMLTPSGQATVLIFGNSKVLSAWSKTLVPQG